MEAQGSITFWINKLKAGDAAAAAPLWNAYFAKMVGLAHHKLSARPGGAAGSEDVALSAFTSFWFAVQKGRFPRLEDRHDLWQVLLTVTARKAIDQGRAETNQKRGGRWTQQDADEAFSGLMGREPTPDLAVQVADECRRLLDRLGDAELAAIAVDKMEGYANAEIAERRTCSLATVERRLQLIRRLWEEEAPA